MSQTFTEDGVNVLPDNFVTRDQLIAWALNLQPKTGTMLAAVQGLVTTGIIRVTNATPGSQAMDTVSLTATGAAVINMASVAALRQYQVDFETLTGSGAANPAIFLTRLVSTSGGPYAITLAAGTYNGQLKCFSAPVLTTQNFVLTGTLAGISSITFGTAGGGIGYSALLQWDGASWQWQGGNGVVA